jgi:hypothetical protein
LFGLLGKRGESCPEARLVRGVGDDLEAGRTVDGIGLCVWVSMFLVPCVLHMSSQSCIVSSFLTLVAFTWGVRRRTCCLGGRRWLIGKCFVGIVLSWCTGVNCGSRGEPLGDGVLLCGGQPGWSVGVRVARMILYPVFRGYFVCSAVIMVNSQVPCRFGGIGACQIYTYYRSLEHCLHYSC